jgi:hypothetical protein
VKVLLLMMLGHLFADYTLQGCLANLKQKGWWKEQCEQHGFDLHKYRHDYICGLACHSLYWTLVTFLPLFFFTQIPDMVLFAIVAINTLFHMWIDDLKANKFKINLVQDQVFHFAQIIVTCGVVYGVFWF